jgi:hypothetical protein
MDFVCDVDEDYRSACKGLEYYNEYEGKRYCALHFPGEVKTDAFEKAVKRKLEGKDYDFGGTVFSEGGTTPFKDFEFDAEVNFHGATFIGEAHFGTTKFRGERTNFSDTHFRGTSTTSSYADAVEARAGAGGNHHDYRTGPVQRRLH